MIPILVSPTGPPQGINNISIQLKLKPLGLVQSGLCLQQVFNQCNMRRVMFNQRLYP